MRCCHGNVGCRINSFGAREKSAKVSHRENPVLEQAVTSSWLKRVPQKNPVLEPCLKRVPRLSLRWNSKSLHAVSISPNWAGGIRGASSNHSAHQEWRYSKETILLFPLAIILLKQWSVKLELSQDLMLGKWKAGARRAARLEIYLLEKDLHLVLTLQQKMTLKGGTGTEIVMGETTPWMGGSVMSFKPYSPVWP